MAARRCDKCERCFKPGADRTHCPFCPDNEPLSYSTKHTPDTPWPDEPLPPVTPEVEQEVAAGFEALTVEARKRGPNWSLVDALEVWDPSDRAA